MKWNQALSKCLSMTHSTSPDLQSALSGPISTLRGLALRSFPELLVDIRTAQGGGTTSAISDTTYSTLTYLETLPAYDKTVEGLLGRSQSERSWLMGAKEAPSPVRSASEEGGTVNLFVGMYSAAWSDKLMDSADVLGTLLIHLDGKSKSMRKPVGQAFLLNNRGCHLDVHHDSRSWVSHENTDELKSLMYETRQLPSTPI